MRLPTSTKWETLLCRHKKKTNDGSNSFLWSVKKKLACSKRVAIPDLAVACFAKANAKAFHVQPPANTDGDPHAKMGQNINDIWQKRHVRNIDFVFKVICKLYKSN